MIHGLLDYEKEKVRIDYHDSEEVASSSRKLLFLCDKEMKKIRQSNRLLYSTWQISESTAKRLIQNIETQKKKPPKYNIVGNSALAASSASIVATLLVIIVSRLQE